MTDEEFYNKKKNTKKRWKQLILNGEKQNYDVSNTGEIRNHTTKFVYSLTKTKGMKNCYEFFRVKLNDGTSKSYGIHRLVAIMFIPIPKRYIKKGLSLNDLVVDHIDDIKYHNIKSNLQWLTYAENNKKSMLNAPISDIVITKKIVRKICNDLSKGKTIYEISLKYSVSELLVHDIKYKLRYTNISKDYVFQHSQTSIDDVEQICKLLEKGLSVRRISDEYGYSKAVVNHILSNNSWTNISKKYTFPNKRIDDTIIVKICELLQDGKTPKEISDILNVNKRLIEHIKWGETHKDISKNYTFNNLRHKYSDDVVVSICKDLESKSFTNKEIAKRNSVPLGFVKNIKGRVIRKYISDNYKW